MFFFFSSLMLVIMLLFSPVLQDSTHLSDISSGSGHQYRLDQLGQPEPRLPAQWWGLQSLPSFLHLGLWPSHCYAGRSAPWGQFKGGGRKKERKKVASWDVSWLTLLPTLPGPLPPPFSFLFINGALRHKAVRGRLIPLSWHGHKLTHTHKHTYICLYTKIQTERCGVVLNINYWLFKKIPFTVFIMFPRPPYEPRDEFILFNDDSQDWSPHFPHRPQPNVFSLSQESEHQ